MHPRNIFKTPTDYTELAIKYAEFRKVCQLELNGRVRVNYKSEDALRALAQTLLQEYFQLKVEFAPGSLIPTVPLRLNYILWLEDILFKDNSIEKPIKGIDIGCGSSCIYSLLSARKNNWFMVALESNTVNLDYAQRNIIANNMESFITLFAQKDVKHIFHDFFQSIEKTIKDNCFNFCMCNPPFYDKVQKIIYNRNGKRPQPHNCPTGNIDEISCDGGEVNFVQKIITESLQYKNQIKIFTSMLGHKTSLVKIIDILKKHDIENFCTSEFHQGKTTRWAIAWSFSSFSLK